MPRGGISNVSGRVDVGVDLMPAGHAPEERLALATLPGTVPAGVAGLRRETRIDLLNSAWSLVLQPDYEPAPPGGEDAPVQARLLPDVTTRRLNRATSRAGHRGDLQRLDRDHLETARQIGRGLLHPVLAPIGLTSLQPGDGEFHLRAPVRSPLGSRKSALQPQQSFPLGVAQGGHAQHLTRGQRRRHRYSSIHPDDPTRTRRGDRLGDHRERDMPTPRRIPGDPVRLRLGDGARPAKPHPPHLRNSHLADVARHPAHITGLDRDDPEALVASAAAPGGLAVGFTEEVRHRLVKVLERLLLNRHRPGTQPRERRPRLGELTTLLGETRRGPPCSASNERAAPPRDSTQNAHARNAPATPAPERVRAEAENATRQPTYRHSPSKTRRPPRSTAPRLLPAPKDRASTP